MQTQPNEPETPKVAMDLQAVMWDNITKLQNNQTTAANVNAINGSARTIISIAKLRLEYMKLSGIRPNIAELAQLSGN